MTIEFKILENYGKFKNIDASCPLNFGQLTLIYGPNASGKSIGTRIFQSVGANLPSLMMERHKFGTKNPIEVGLIIDESPVSFSNGKWSQAIPNIEVFDDHFIAKSGSDGFVGSGLPPFTLLDSITGNEGVKLNEQLAKCVARLERLEQQLLEFDTLIPMCVRAGHTVQEFVDLTPEVGLEQSSTVNVNATESNDPETLYNNLIQNIVIRNRSDPNQSALCKDYQDMTNKILNAKRDMEEVRQQISTLRQQAIPQFFEKVNPILTEIFTDFKLVSLEDDESAQTDHINFYLQINKQNIPFGTDVKNHLFENTLSQGDRNSLALALFLAKLELEDDLENKIIVFDDPISSLDVSRAHFLQHVIAKLTPNVKAVIVFSRSKPFLHGICRASQDIEPIGFELKRSTNNETIFRNWDIKEDLLPDFQKRLNRINKFVADASSEDSKQVASDLQAVLETYCQIHFGEEFMYTKRIGELEYELIYGETKSCVPISELKIKLLGELLDFLNPFQHIESDIIGDEDVTDRRLINYINPFHYNERASIDGEDITDGELILYSKKLLVFMGYLDEIEVE